MRDEHADAGHRRVVHQDRSVRAESATEEARTEHLAHVCSLPASGRSIHRTAAFPVTSVARIPMRETQSNAVTAIWSSALTCCDEHHASTAHERDMGHVVYCRVVYMCTSTVRS